METPKTTRSDLAEYYVPIVLPEYARVIRGLPLGDYPYLSLLPLIIESPATRRIGTPAVPLGPLLDAARVRIEAGDHYVWVDDKAPAIVLTEHYYSRGNDVDLYLDLIHELTHLRQLAEGRNIWDRRVPYVDRSTEIEGYAVAIEEGLRLGMTESGIIGHLSNPWMTHAEVLRLRENVARFLRELGTQ
jgi:hypothetical protein